MLVAVFSRRVTFFNVLIDGKHKMFSSSNTLYAAELVE